MHRAARRGARQLVAYNSVVQDPCDKWEHDDWLGPWRNEPSRYLIHDNQFATTASFGRGLHLQNPAENPWINAIVLNNTITSSETLLFGIAALDVRNTAFVSNTIRGTGVAAIALFGVTQDSSIRNDVQHFNVDKSIGGPVHIYLDPNARQDLVVCSQRPDTVLNQGSANKIVGCQAQ